MKVSNLNALILILFTFFSSCNQDVSINNPPENQYEIAKLFIDSKPNNAQIFVDGKNSGKSTPDTITYLSNGEHEVTLKMYLFQDVTFAMTADSNHINKYFHDYYAYPENFASINVVSSPNSATILLDDTLLTQKTPYLLKDIYPGNHKIKIVYPEHRADSVELFFRGGTNTNLDFFLEDTTVWVTYNKENSLFKSYNINDVFVDKFDMVWIATSDSGIYQIKNKTWKVLNSNNSPLYDNHVVRIKESPNGNIWICTNKGLFKYDYNIWEEYTTFNTDLPTNVIFDIDFGDNDLIWIATQKGLVKFDGINFKTYNSRDSEIPSDFVTSLVQDKHGRIWIGTSGNGIGLFTPESDKWRTYTTPIDLYGNIIYDITMDKYGSIWASLKPDKLEGQISAISKLSSDGFWQSVSLDKIYYKINRFCFDNDDNLIIATTDGVIWYQNVQYFLVYNKQTKKLPYQNISSVSFDSKGNYWLGTKGGGIIKYKTWNDPNFN